ncbi:MAG: SigE family RNA polymerase sigma factor [Micromonosporaceae bacterium]
MEDLESFEGFVNARSQALLRYGYVLTGDPHSAADLLQESLVRLRGAWGRLRDRSDPEGYVRVTMARLHISIWRRRRRERLVDAVPERGYTDHGFDRALGDAGLWQALATLPRRQRAVLVLRYYEGRTDAEIAETLGISTGTVRSQASRALGKLRAGWQLSDDSLIPVRGRA